MIKAVVMAGGEGSRLWPLSRTKHPKQFLSLHDKNTMLQSTMNRLEKLNIDSSITICNEEHRFFVAEQLREINKLDTILLEPIGKNTAPAIALAALLSDDNDLLLVLAADHVVDDEEAFCKNINEAVPLANEGKLVTFGIVPSEAHTGYGYIKKGTKYKNGFIVKKFEEKPSLEVAKKYISTEKYLWNSGMFLFKASRYLEELKKYRPDIYKACKESIEIIEPDLDFLRLNKSKFVDCPSESIDYAVMEKTNSAVVIPLNVGWSDIGSWSSLWEISNKDKSGNSVTGDVMVHNSENCYVRSDNKLIALVGCNNMVIVDTKDALLVANKDTVQETKLITKKLKIKERSECELHREVYRPWGKYDSIDNGAGYQVKRITVNPGAKLSLQKHKYRSEHWIVVSGIARVTKGDKIFLLEKNESTYIPLGEIHSLENPGEVNLELIEVQSGSYLGEDDIIRVKDIYGRAKISDQ